MGVPERKSPCKLAEYTPILRVKAFNKKLYSLQRQEPASWRKTRTVEENRSNLWC